jgi:hypothetical protein
MVNLTRNKRTIYLCKKKANSLEFEQPITLKVNYRPTYSSSDALALGNNYNIYQTIKCTPKIAENFTYNDRIYINEPEEFNPSCNDADYYVYGNPLVTLNEAEITIRKLSGDLYEEEN